MSSFYITTPIYYVNDHPHIGHIYTTLVADTIARYRRRGGEEVYFLTGTDEHGQKIERAAADRGIAPIELADEVVARYHELWQRLGISNDVFMRTTEPRHADGVRELVRRMAAQGDFYVDQHGGWYCTGCETFYTEKELVDGERCPIHERPAERRDEQNIFFRLSKYQDALLEWYDQPGTVQPESRRNEVRQFVAGGLRDLSVSRMGLAWGIPFPEHEGQTIYVWLDALTNYLSALGLGAEGDEARQLYDTFWASDGTRVHLVGKDILRFHAVYWPAFLMSAGLPLPTTVWAHGWWLKDDQKMSKSVGNVVRPDELIEHFGVDTLRYFLLRDMSFGQDASFSDEAFIDRYNSDLANTLGNTVSRLVTLSRRAFGDRLPPSAGNALADRAAELIAEYRRHMDGFAFHRGLEALWRLLDEINQYLVAEAPWKLLKDPDEANLAKVSEILWCGLEGVRLVATALLPVLPEKAPQVLRALGEGDDAGDWSRLEWGLLASGRELPAVEPIFPRGDKKAYFAQTEGGANEPAAKPSKKKTQNKSKKTQEKSMTDTATQTSVTQTEAPADATTEADEASEPAEPKISIDQFFETVLRVATIQEAEKVPKSSKLMQLTVDVGEDAPRTIVAGIAKAYTAEDLVGKQVVVVANLKPAKLMGIESNGMVLAATDDGKPVVLHPAAPVPNGTRVS